MMRYFDHNATTPLLPAAREAWLEASDLQWLNPSSPYRAAAAVHARFGQARGKLASLFQIEPERIVFNSGATEGNNAVFANWADQLGPEARIGLSPTEHPSVLEAAKHFWGKRIVWLTLDADGAVDLEAVNLKKLAAVSVMAANNETGILNPWPGFAQACREAGTLYHCDASQWIGKMPLGGLGDCDYVSGCAHKFGGPKGVGFLIAPEGAGQSLHGGVQEDGRRAGTEDVAGVLAMVAALEVAEEKRRGCSPELREAFWQKLHAVMPAAKRIGNSDTTLWNTLAIVLPDFSSARWIRALEKRGCFVSSGSACSTGKEGPSHVLSAMGMDSSDVGRAIRISSGWGSGEADWKALLEAILESHKALSADASESNSQVISI